MPQNQNNIMPLNNKNVLKNVSILFLLTAVVFLGYSLNQRAKSDAYTASNLHLLAKKVLSVTPKVEKGLRDTFRMIMLQTKHDTIPNPPLTIHDTIEIHNRVELLKKTLLSYGRLKDSLTAMDQDKRKLTGQVSALIAQSKKISDQPVIHIDGSQSRIDSNADIVVLPFKKSARKNFFSPQKNYWRVYNKTPGGTINTQPWVDYAETNDQINQLLLQARSAYNFTSKTFSYGPGVELKLNRFSVNLAEFFNSNNGVFRHPTTSLGTRFDLYRIRFK